MRRLALLLALVVPCAGCWPEACVLEREPWAPDLCTDDYENVFFFDEPEREDCVGETHAGETCAKLGFTEACGRYLIRPHEICEY